MKSTKQGRTSMETVETVLSKEDERVFKKVQRMTGAQDLRQACLLTLSLYEAYNRHQKKRIRSLKRIEEIKKGLAQLEREQGDVQQIRNSILKTIEKMEWEVGQEEADGDLLAGRVKRFGTVEEMIESLKQPW